MGGGWWVWSVGGVWRKGRGITISSQATNCTIITSSIGGVAGGGVLGASVCGGDCVGGGDGGGDKVRRGGGGV